MSRTRKGSKPMGYDYWSKRPYSKNGYGKDVKIMTHRKERAIGKEELYKEVNSNISLVEVDVSKNMIRNRITFALDAAQEMYDELHDKFMEWHVHDEPFPPECEYMQDLQCVIESLEKALGEIDE